MSSVPKHRCDECGRRRKCKVVEETEHGLRRACGWCYHKYQWDATNGPWDPSKEVKSDSGV